MSGDERYTVTAAGFLFCRDCGCLIMEGYRQAHDGQCPIVQGVVMLTGKQALDRLAEAQGYQAGYYDWVLPESGFYDEDEHNGVLLGQARTCCDTIVPNSHQGTCRNSVMRTGEVRIWVV